ncbi:MAG: hypothetical protein U0892_21545 [Pirellulales bacterium]
MRNGSAYSVLELYTPGARRDSAERTAYPRHGLFVGSVRVCALESDWAPLAYSALANQKEARNRCLNLIVFGQGLPVEHAVNLNRLRRMVEMVSDQLLSLLPTGEELSEYAFDPATVQAEQAILAGQSLLSPHAQFRSQVLSSSLVSAAAHALSPQVASPRLNQELAEAVTAMFPSVGFDDFGLVSGPMHRISSATIAEQDIDFSDLTRPVPAPYSLLGTPERPSRTSPHNRRLN